MVSVYAANKYGDLDYVELAEMPVLTGNQHKILCGIKMQVSFGRRPEEIRTSL